MRGHPPFFLKNSTVCHSVQAVLAQFGDHLRFRPGRNRYLEGLAQDLVQVPGQVVPDSA